MVDLPTRGHESEVIIQKAHRFGYDHAVRKLRRELVESRLRRTSTARSATRPR